jgi:hypothetical protein
MPVKEVGRELAERRALKAFIKRKSFGKIKSPKSDNIIVLCRQNYADEVIEIFDHVLFKCGYQPKLSSFETRLIIA